MNRGVEERFIGMPQLEGPATKIYNYVPEEIWGDKAEKKKAYWRKRRPHVKVPRVPVRGWQVGASDTQERKVVQISLA